jgi:protein O-mannosyl-transferase
VLPGASLACLLLLAATTYGQIGYWRDSLTLLRHTQAVTAEGAAIHEFLGGAELAEGDPSEAVKELEQAARYSPTYIPVQINLGIAFQKLGRLDEAAAHYRRAIELGDRSRELFVNLGFVLDNSGQVEEAKVQYRQALEIDPNFVPALINLGIASLATGDNAAAITYAEQALKVDPNLANCHVYIASALRAQGHFDDAIRHLQRANELQPNDPEVLNELARTRSMQQNASHVEQGHP